ncbi:unnamed protein product, partial [marine sediment metagenome]
YYGYSSSKYILLLHHSFLVPLFFLPLLLNLGDKGSGETENNLEVQAVTSGIKIINFIATGT